MHRARRVTLLAALAALTTTASPVASYAASCEAALKPRYKCTATYDGGGSAEYCLDLDAVIPGDGRFYLYESGGAGFYCTCEAKGKVPNVRFGTSSRDFFCGSDSIALTGKMSATRITGQGYNVSLSSGLRSSFTCQAVATCP